MVRRVPPTRKTSKRVITMSVESESGGLLHVTAEFAAFAGGRFGPVRVVIENDAGVTAGDLRRVPLATLDRTANNLREILDGLDELPLPRRTAGARPEDPDAFYKRVALRYARVVEDTHAPAPVLAEEAGVPVTTVHRWIREARRRGYLPPARRGAAG
jgi:hypothetical protein